MSSSATTAQAPDLSGIQSNFMARAGDADAQMKAAQAWATAHGMTLDDALKQIQPQTFATSKAMQGFGTDMLKKYIDQYGPMAESQAKYAMNYDTPDRERQAMAQGAGDVSDAFKAQGDAANRQLERYGVDPSVGRGGALDLGVKIAQATATAGRMDMARRATQTTGQQLIEQALGTGQNIANTGLGTANAGVSAGATGVGEGTSTFSTQAPSLGNTLGWFGAGNQALGGAFNVAQGGFQDAAHNADQQNQATQANQAAIGKLAGTGASMLMFADKGGAVPLYAQGGAAPVHEDASPGSAVPLSASPSRGQVEDDVPARVQPGEFIFPKDVMAWKGEEWAQKEIMKAREAQRNPHGKPAKPEMKPALTLPPTYRSPGALHGHAVPLGA